MSDHPLHILQWLAEMGEDVALGDVPVNRFEESTATKPAAVATGTERQGGKSAATASIRERAAALKKGGSGQQQQKTPVLPDEGVIATARELSEKAGSLDELKAAMEGFEGCNLRLTAKNLVFADGNPKAKIMLVGEAPGRDEDIQGLPFVGKSGQLLDRMLAAIGLNRETVYISNVIPWRPPGNRTPTPAEVEICRPFIERHMELVAPDLLVMVGGSSAKMMLQTTEGILKLRGRWQNLVIGGREVDAIATLHPAYLLRQPAQKRLAWHDLLTIREKLDQSGKA